MFNPVVPPNFITSLPQSPSLSLSSMKIIPLHLWWSICH